MCKNYGDCLDFQQFFCKKCDKENGLNLKYSIVEMNLVASWALFSMITLMGCIIIPNTKYLSIYITFEALLSVWVIYSTYKFIGFKKENRGYGSFFELH